MHHHRRIPLAAVLLVAAVAILVPAQAGAVTIHRHVYAKQYMAVPADVAPGELVAVQVVRLAPPDGDDDGVANDGTDQCPGTAGLKAYDGCGPPVITSTATGSSGTYDPSGSAGSVASCESSGDPTAVDPSGTYHGLYQFDDQTWQAASGLSGSASDYSAEQQTEAFNNWYPSHPTAWPICG